MKKRLTLLSTLLLIQFFIYGQEFSDSKEFQLTKYDEGLFEKMTSDSEFDGNTEIYLIDNTGAQLKAIDVFIETYENDAKVEEFATNNFQNVRKIVRVITSHCACYCDTAKYYWLVTKDSNFIRLPTIYQEDFEMGMKTKDYVFNSENNTITLFEYQHELIKTDNVDSPTINLKSKTALKNYTWNGEELTEL